MRVEIPQPNALARVAVWLLLRGLAGIYFIAFSSLIPQLGGLIGEHGILPAQDYLDALGRGVGTGAFFAVPSLFWLHLSDGLLQGTAWAGTILSGLLFFDFAPGLLLLLLWALYLSVVSVGQDFFAFQWDGMLLETGLLAMLAAPWRLGSRFFTLPVPPLFPVFLLRWLLFRFMLLNGVVKLTSGDPAWHDLTALTYHYFSQPLPSPLSWFFFHLPLWFHKASTVILFVIELGLPVLALGNYLTRRIAFVGIVGLQMMIVLTGNLAFLNYLTLVLALILLDDGCFVWINRLEGPLTRPFRVKRPARAQVALTLGLGGFLFFWSLVATIEGIWPENPLPEWLGAAQAYVDPWRSVNGYGLFRVMTKERNEIVIEGSDDGNQWLEYDFPYKPGDLKRIPAFVAPYQPRLDWQMWFAALSSGDKTPWFQNLLVRLLQGSPEVLRLFSHNPFPDHPPHYVRAMFYSYRFTTGAERTATGDWWEREPAGWYYPAITLNASEAPAPNPLP